MVPDVHLVDPLATPLSIFCTKSFSVDDEASKLTPLASAFDLRAVAAPPVVYMPHDHNEKVSQTRWPPADSGL